LPPAAVLTARLPLTYKVGFYTRTVFPILVGRENFHRFNCLTALIPGNQGDPVTLERLLR
jgi:hypothetical protein